MGRGYLTRLGCVLVFTLCYGPPLVIPTTRAGMMGEFGFLALGADGEGGGTGFLVRSALVAL